MRRILGAALLVAVAACARKQQTPSVQIATVTRRDIIIDAQANGVIEPITIIEVKSKASGVITKMPVETGTHLNPGDLIVQIDTRDVQNRYDQAKASLDAAEAKLAVTESDKKRNEEMYKARVITPQEFEQIGVSYETAKSAVISAKANLDLAKQALEDATVTAPSRGTVIEKTVAEGTVIASANGSASGGTTIIKMADLGVVRVRALFNEADIGNIHPGEPANVTVDAYPDRRFSGSVEKIEPQAVVQQNVTMFPVLVNLDNREGLLRPGMNGSIAVLIDEYDGVLAIPNDAIKNPREAVATGAMLGLSADTVASELKEQGFNLTGGSTRGGFGGGANGGGGRRGGGNGGSADGSVGPMLQGGPQQAGFGGPQVSDADCKNVEEVLKAHPAEKKKLDDLNAKLAALRPAGFGGAGRGGFGGGNRGSGENPRPRGGTQGDSTRQGGGGRGPGNPEMAAINEQMREIYTTLKLDARTAGACRRRATGGANSGGAAMQNTRQGAGNQRLTPTPEMNGRPQRARAGLVFVSDTSRTIFHPRIVQLGASNLDFTVVLSGLEEGEQVVMLGALAMQAQRLQQQERQRANANPLGTQGGPGPGPGGGGPGGRGGGGRGGR